jgi:NAD(P)H dehydrogenase (quinone)
MARILVLYYSSYGHIAQMADAVAEGVRGAGHEAEVLRVPETAPPEVAVSAGFRVADHHAQIGGIEALAQYDGIVVGAPTRFGRMPSQMAAFLDQAGGLWFTDALVGKVGAAFTSTAAQHGGQETTLFSIITNLLHLGLVVVGLPYSAAGQMRIDEITGGSPYGATTIAGGKCERQPSQNEIDLIKFQGRHVAEIAAKLFGKSGA